MGNEHSTNKELLNKNGTIPEKHGNGSANGISANISSNGIEIAVDGETKVQQNGKPFSLNLATESNDFVIVESDAPVISEILEAIVLKEEVKESNEDQTDVGLPATDLQTESTASEEEAATVIIAVRRENFECPCRKAEISTQTDRIIEADISTQTIQKDDDDTTTDTEDPVKEVVAMEAAATKEDPLNESACVIAEELVQETAKEEPVDNQTAVIINEEVVMESFVYENIWFRTEWVTFTDIKNYDPEEESMTGRDETEPDNAAEPDSNQNEPIIEDEIVAEEDCFEETLPLEVYYSLPKVVADCIKAVFAAVPPSTGFAAVNTSVPIAHEVIPEDNGEGAGDMSVDVVLTETAEPQSNAVTPESQEANGVPSSATTLMEAISEEPDPTPANQDVPVEELSVPLVTPLLVKVESAHEEVTADDAVAPEDVPGIPEQEKLADEPIPEDCTTDEKIEVGEDVIADVRPKRYEEAEPSPVFVKYYAELIPEAAINALSQQFESTNITPQEAAVDNGFLVEEEVITATTYAALSGEQEANVAIPEELVETVADETNEDAVGALSNEIEAVPESVEDDATNVSEEPADVPPMDATEEPEPCVSVQEELKDENVAPAEVPTDSNHVVSEEPVEESSSLVARQLQSDMLTVILNTIEDEVMKAIMYETDHSAVEENSEDSQIATSDEPVSEGVDAVLEAIVEEIIREDVVTAECNFVTSEEVAPEVIVEGETEEEDENESSVNSTDSTPDSQSVTRTDMEALAARLQSACISVVEEPTHGLGGLTLSSLGYSITVIIHVAPKQEQQ